MFGKQFSEKKKYYAGKGKSNFYPPRFYNLYDNSSFSIQHVYKKNAEGCRG